MRKVVLYGLAVVCVCMLFALSGPSAQRIVNGDGGGSTGTAPVAVSVANFPTVQTVQAAKPITVTGSVAVTNLPAVQEVAGTVSVGNLPVDADGNLRVSAAMPAGSGPRHLLGVTQGTFVLDQGLFPLARACEQDFPGSRPCTTSEVMATANPPTLSPGQAWVLPVHAFFSAGVDANPQTADIPTGIVNVGNSLTCNGFISAGTNAIAVDQNGRFARVSCELVLPVACCGY